MKHILIACLLLSGTLVLDAQDASEPGSLKKTFAVLPGRVMDFRNKIFRTVEIRSEYPVEILAGSCRAESKAQWTCKFDDPADIFIRDLRPHTTDPSVRANTVVLICADPDETQNPPGPPPVNAQAAQPQEPPPAEPAPAQAEPPPQQSEAKSRVHTYRLGVGDHLDLTNTSFTDLEIHSTGPIHVAIGECHNTFIYRIRCHSDIPADISILDARASQQSGVNLVVITGYRP
jgi:hypothetical protein